MKLFSVIASMLILSIANAHGAEATTKKKNEAVEEPKSEPAYTSQRIGAGVSHFDLMLGLAKLTGDVGEEVDMRIGYGAQFLYGATPELSIGAFYTTNSGDIDGSDDVSLRTSHYGLAAQYKVDPMFFVQGRAGFSTIEVSSDRFNASVKFEKHPFILGAGFGADIPINSMISFAPFINYTHSFKAGSDTDPDGKVESYGLIEAMGVVRFNF